MSLMSRLIELATEAAFPVAYVSVEQLDDIRKNFTVAGWRYAMEMSMNLKQIRDPREGDARNIAVVHGVVLRYKNLPEATEFDLTDYGRN